MINKTYSVVCLAWMGLGLVRCNDCDDEQATISLFSMKNPLIFGSDYRGGIDYFLWNQWLIQNLANIFVYAPRQVPLAFLLFAIIIFVVVLALILYQRGRAIQKIVDIKTGVTDRRATTLIGFMYALILLVFKE